MNWQALVLGLLDHLVKSEGPQVADWLKTEIDALVSKYASKSK